jgi:uncharacterized YccA/Bax inhibitor family protein
MMEFYRLSQEVTVSHIDSAIKRNLSFTRAGEKSFKAHRVYDRLAMMVAIAAVSGSATYLAVNAGANVMPLVLIAFIVSLGCGLAGSFRPHLSPKVAIPYAVFEGILLGAISKSYSTIASGAVTLALIGTAAFFVGCLVLFRSGIVKVTPRFMQVVGAASIAFLIMVVLSLFGLPIPGVRDVGTKGILFGLFGLAIGLGSLFIDFERVRKIEEDGTMTANAEWFLALQLMMSLVMVYINLLRIIASSQSRR